MKALSSSQLAILIFSTVLMKGALQALPVRVLSPVRTLLFMKREGRQWERGDA
jgi:hypothetical protein